MYPYGIELRSGNRPNFCSMKNVLLLLLLSFLIFSCEEFENPDVTEMPQEWILKGYKSSWVPQDDITPIPDSTYFYRLKADGSFVKTIGEYNLSGTYNFETGSEGEKFVFLNYDEASFKISQEWGGWGLIHYCGQDYEIFKILNSKTVQGSWGSCDGPILIFSRR